VSLAEICAELDVVQMSKVFMMLLSHAYINQNAQPEFHIKTQCFTCEFLINVCHLNNTVFEKVLIVKKVIVPIVDGVRLEEVADDVPMLKVLKQ